MAPPPSVPSGPGAALPTILELPAPPGGHGQGLAVDRTRRLVPPVLKPRGLRGAVAPPPVKLGSTGAALPAILELPAPPGGHGQGLAVDRTWWWLSEGQGGGRGAGKPPPPTARNKTSFTTNINAAAGGGLTYSPAGAATAVAVVGALPDAALARLAA